jgi:hypothetical protein
MLASSDEKNSLILNHIQSLAAVCFRTGRMDSTTFSELVMEKGTRGGINGGK